jgi:hypothetical protein
MRKFVYPSALLTLAACGHGHRHVHAAPPPPPEPRLVSILVEVYDPVTNFVWENVSVRLVEADQEWSQCTCVSPFLDWRLTDGAGRVYFDEYDLAAAQLGFQHDGAGRALVGPYGYEDEATVWLEVDAVGFSPVIVPVRLSWNTPDVFVEIPF